MTEAIEDKTMAEQQTKKTIVYHNQRLLLANLPNISSETAQKSLLTHVQENLLTKKKNNAKDSAIAKIENTLSKQEATAQNTSSDEYTRFNWSKPKGNSFGTQLINALKR